MPNPVEISVVVDTDKLLQLYPNGGHIDDRTIVKMSDNQPDSYYDDSNGDQYHDKLHTLVDMDDDIFWTIEARNKTTHLIFDSAQGELLTLFNEAPKAVGPKDQAKFTAKVKTGLKKKVKLWYTFTFKIDGDDRKWDWDPVGESRQP